MSASAAAKGCQVLQALCLAAWIIVTSTPAPAAEPRSELARIVSEIRQRPIFRGSKFGIVIANVETGRVLYSLNRATLFAPASTVKVLSAAGALATLGKDFRFRTKIVATGPVKGGTLRGDLVLVGAGDPNLSQRVTSSDRLAFKNNDHSYAGSFRGSVVDGNPLKVIHSLAKQVKQIGVRAIEGNIVVDDGLFADTSDEFAGPLSAVCINDNLIDVFIQPAKRVGDPPLARSQPSSKAVTIVNRARTVATGGKTQLWLEMRPGLANYELHGTIALESKPVLRVAPVNTPGLLASHYLADALENQSIRIDGESKHSRFGPTIYARYPVLVTHISPPLSEAIRVTLKVSQNVHASMLPLLVGALHGERSTRREGFRVIREHFSKSLDMGAVAVSGGSGGGRADRLSPGWMVTFLRHLSRRDDFQVLFDALPIGGVDGTLANSFRGSILSEKVHAKTGTLVYRDAFNGYWVYATKSLAGYLDLRTRRRPDNLWAFMIVTENTLAPTRRRGAHELMRAHEEILRTAITEIEKLPTSPTN